MALVAKYAVSLLALGGLLWFADTEPVLAALVSADAMWLSLSGLCSLATTVLMAGRWHRVARMLDLDLTFGRALREYVLSNLINQTVPGGVVGDVARAVRNRHQGDLKTAAWSVAAERILGQIILMGIMALGFAVSLGLPGGIAWPNWAWGGVALAFGLPVLLWTKNWTPIAQLTQFLRDPLLLILSLTIFGCLVTGFWAAARAIGADLPPSTFFTLIPLALSAMLVPLSVGGWGWREGAAAALFPLVGLDASLGIAAGVAYGAVLLITAIPALIVLAFPVWGPTRPRPNAAREEEIST